MKLQNVLITGGAGYVGAILVPKLLEAGYLVRVIDWFIYGNKVFGKYENHPNLDKIVGDIRDGDLVKGALKGMDAVIHLACISNDPSFELAPELGKSVNYDATIQLADLAKQNNIKRFIYASSSSVYGVKTEKKVTEKLSLEPLTDYSKYKMLSENYLLPLNDKNFTVTVLRPATVCGYSTRMRLDLTVNILTIQALVNKHITVNGGGQTRPNIHIEDITDLYVLMLKYPKKLISGKIFNAGYENYSVAEIAQMVKDTIGDKKISIETKPTVDNRSYRISSDLIRKELGYKPKHTVEEAISDIRDAYNSGLFKKPMEKNEYYNIKTMKMVNIDSMFSHNLLQKKSKSATLNEHIQSYLNELKHCLDNLSQDKITEAVEILMTAYRSDRKIFIIGNGGSASNASHFACDLSKGTLARVYDDNERRFKVYSLTDNVAILTAFANDVSYDDVFIQQLRNLVEKDDVVIVLTGSGNSVNLIKAVKYAKKCGAKSIGFLGFKTGGKVGTMIDCPIIADSTAYGPCEDLQLVLDHLMISWIAKIKHLHDPKSD